VGREEHHLTALGRSSATFRCRSPRRLSRLSPTRNRSIQSHCRSIQNQMNRSRRLTYWPSLPTSQVLLLTWPELWLSCRPSLRLCPSHLGCHQSSLDRWRTPGCLWSPDRQWFPSRLLPGLSNPSRWIRIPSHSTRSTSGQMFRPCLRHSSMEPSQGSCLMRRCWLLRLTSRSDRPTR
jgi:hypothetical protein